PGVGSSLHEKLGQIRPVHHFTQHIEDFVASQSLPDFVKLLKQSLEDLSFACVFCDHVENVDLPGLPIPVDAAHPLFKPVWVPRDVVVDHEMAKLEVDALASCL